MKIICSHVLVSVLCLSYFFGECVKEAVDDIVFIISKLKHIYIICLSIMHGLLVVIYEEMTSSDRYAESSRAINRPLHATWILPFSVLAVYLFDGFYILNYCLFNCGQFFIFIQNPVLLDKTWNANSEIQVYALGTSQIRWSSVPWEDGQQLEHLA